MIKLLDTKRSILTSKEIHRFRQEIVKIKDIPICKYMTTNELVNNGINCMKEDHFYFTKKKLDI